MIISRTPFRVSFFGGGTDYPAWYREHGGAVISASINKYCYITCRYLPPVDLVHHADLPARSGLGSSSTFTVGLLHALYALKHEMPTKRQLAINAIRIEQDRIGEHVGSQDQTAAAFGGLNKITFGGAQEIDVRPLIMRPERLERLQQHVMMFFTGYSRTASEVAKDQIEQIPNKKLNLRQMMQNVDEAEAILLDKSDRLDDFGRLLHEQWKLKRELSSKISTSQIDEIYETGIKIGALGGKLIGAGGGGFMLFIARPEQQDRIKAALSGLLYVPCRFDLVGSQIIYYSHHDEF